MNLITNPYMDMVESCITTTGDCVRVTNSETKKPFSKMYMDIMKKPIQNHTEYPDIIKAIEKWGSKPKGILVAAAYDESGESYTRHELRQMDKGKLLAIIIDQIWDGGVT